MLRLLLHHALHALKHGDDPAQEGEDAAVEDRGAVRGAVWAAGGVVAVLFLALLAEGLFERDGEADGEPGELDHEVGAAAEVEVGELAEGALDVEQAGDFVV